MDKPAAIRGCFSDFKIIRTRKLCQIIIEVPIEQADSALAALGGVPRSDDEKWVAIARLDINAMKAPLPHPKERREFFTLPMPNQAGIRSDDLKFQLWLGATYGGVFQNVDDCAQVIREICGVKSRKEILPGTAAGDKWVSLLREYEGYR